MKSKKDPCISAIVTNYNGWELGLLEDFFTSFLKDDYENFEIFLVDMVSADGSIEKVKDKFGKDKRLNIIRNPVNNMSAGINMALKKARGKYVLFLNNDIYFQRGALTKMVRFMEDHPDVGQVQGKVVSYFDHKKIDSVGESMDLYGNPVTLGAGEEDKGQYNKPGEVLSVGGASALLRRSLLSEVGFLDPDYAIGYEDMDMALRLRLVGYKMFYLPDVVVYHRRASSTSRAPEKLKTQIKLWFNKNRIATVIKNYNTSNVLKTLPVILMIYVTSGLFEIFYKRLWRFGLTRFQAIFWMITHFTELSIQRSKIQKLRKLPDSAAFTPFMVKGNLLDGFKGFLESKRW